MVLDKKETKILGKECIKYVTNIDPSPNAMTVRNLPLNWKPDWEYHSVAYLDWKFATISRLSEIFDDPSSLIYLCLRNAMYSSNRSIIRVIWEYTSTRWPWNFNRVSRRSSSFILPLSVMRISRSTNTEIARFSFLNDGSQKAFYLGHCMQVRNGMRI